MVKILITPKEACESMRYMPAELLDSVETTLAYGRVDDSRTLTELLTDKDGVVLDLEHITSDVLRWCPKLKVISRFGEGCDNIDFAFVKKHGIKVTRTDGISSVAVARHTIALIMAIAHNVIGNDSGLKRGAWMRRPNISEESLTVGIMGFGKIGKSVARMAAMLGFKVVVYSRRSNAGVYKHAGSLYELISMADILSLHCPLTAETDKIISKEVIEKLKGKYLVNTARGALVDEDALLDALERGFIPGYAADVFSEEPVNGTSKRLAMHSKVICSPHVAAMDYSTAVNMTRRAVENALNCLNDKHDRVVSYVS